MGMQPAGGWSYRELRIRLEMKKGSEWVQIRWVESPVGDYEGEFRLPVSRDEVEQALEAVGRASQSYALRGSTQDRLDPMRNIGERLFTALFEGRREMFYWQMREEANSQGQGLRLRLEFDQADLAAMPWEFLHDGRDYLALSTASPVVRGTGLPAKPVLPPSEPGLRILMLAPTSDPADPQGPRPVVRLVDSLKKLRERFHDLSFRVVWDPTPKKLFEVISRAEFPFEMLHLVGTAGEGKPGQAVLWLKDESGREVAVEGERLAAALREQPNLRAVYLNVRSGDALALELARSVPALLSLHGPISEQAEVPFAEALYAAILAGQPLEAALTQGRQEVVRSNPGSREWGLPVLYLREADGRLFAPSWPAPGQASFDISGGKTESPQGESRERRKLQALLALRRKNLAALEGQAAAYNLVPLTIQQDLDAQREEIARLEQQLQSTP